MVLERKVGWKMLSDSLHSLRNNGVFKETYTPPRLNSRQVSYGWSEPLGTMTHKIIVLGVLVITASPSTRSACETQAQHFNLVRIRKSYTISACIRARPCAPGRRSLYSLDFPSKKAS